MLKKQWGTLDIKLAHMRCWKTTGTLILNTKLALICNAEDAPRHHEYKISTYLQCWRSTEAPWIYNWHLSAMLKKHWGTLDIKLAPICNAEEALRHPEYKICHLSVILKKHPEYKVALICGAKEEPGHPESKLSVLDAKSRFKEQEYLWLGKCPSSEIACKSWVIIKGVGEGSSAGRRLWPAGDVLWQTCVSVLQLLLRLVLLYIVFLVAGERLRPAGCRQKLKTIRKIKKQEVIVACQKETHGKHDRNNLPQRNKHRSKKTW